MKIGGFKFISGFGGLVNYFIAVEARYLLEMLPEMSRSFAVFGSGDGDKHEFLPEMNADPACHFCAIFADVCGD